MIAAVAVAVSAFVVALPEGTNLMCKRIVFGQIVIVYVGTAIHSSTAQPDHDQDDMVVMHPIQVASSTMLGALASVLAMLFQCFLTWSAIMKLLFWLCCLLTLAITRDIFLHICILLIHACFHFSYFCIFFFGMDINVLYAANFHILVMWAISP